MLERVGQHESVQEQSGPAAEAPEQPLGQEREGFEDALRAATQEAPAEAATLAVSLDGVMAPMKDGARQAKRAAAQAAGRATKGPAGVVEARARRWSPSG